MNQLLTIIKKHQTVCWYPSAGADLNALNYWKGALRNELKPTLFITTDIAYLFNDNRSDFYRDDRGVHKLPEDCVVEKITEPLDVVNFDERLSLLGDYKVPNIQNQAINLDDYESYKSLIKNDNLRRLYELGIAGNESIFKYLFDNYFVDFNNATYIHLKKDGTEIILLNASNREFFNFCKNNLLSIDCIMLQRHQPDDLFVGESEKNVLEALQVREGIVNPNYSVHPISNSNLASFCWKYYGDERDIDSIAYIKYK